MDYVDKKLLMSAAENFGVEINAEQAEKFEGYARLLFEWNQKMNLTAITSPEGVALLHFADSLTLLSAADFKEGASLADVGTGAGFPSVPLAIMRPDMQFTLVDSLNKTVHGRAEELGRDVKYREKFDFATARAVAGLNVLCEYCLPFVKKGGSFLAMKGPSGRDEAAQAENAVKLLGGRLSAVKEFSLGENDRRVIIIDKIFPISQKYPRQSGKIKKSPL